MFACFDIFCGKAKVIMLEKSTWNKLGIGIVPFTVYTKNRHWYIYMKALNLMKGYF